MTELSAADQDGLGMWEARGVDPEREAEARKLFFAYEGSTFYMSRDGRDDEFEALAVPTATKRRWLGELAKQRLVELSEPGGWRSVSFLVDHSLLGHLPVLLETAPAGKPWERTSFLELATQYVDRCAMGRVNGEPAEAAEYTPAVLRSALQRLHGRAKELAREHRMRGQCDRLTKLAEDIQQRLDASEGKPTTGPTLWNWDALNRQAEAGQPQV